MRLPPVPMLPLNVVTRALDDLHALAEAARWLPDIEAMLTQQFEVLNRQAEQIIAMGDRILEFGERIDARAEGILKMGEQIDARAEAILELGERINARGEQIDSRAVAILELGERIHERGAALDARAAELLEHSDRLDQRADAVLAESQLVRDAAHEVAVRGAEVAAALPTLQQIATTTEPLQGAIERFGRMVDRLPGGDRERRP